jgi:hypothetical protein
MLVRFLKGVSINVALAITMGLVLVATFGLLVR